METLRKEAINVISKLPDSASMAIFICNVHGIRGKNLHIRVICVIRG